MLIAKRGVALNFCYARRPWKYQGIYRRIRRQRTFTRRACRDEKTPRRSRDGRLFRSVYWPDLSAGNLFTDRRAYELGSVLKGHDLPYTSHMRNEGASLLESVREVIEIGEHAGIKVHISHIKTAGRQNWHKADAAVSVIDDARRRGFR